MDYNEGRAFETKEPSTQSKTYSNNRPEDGSKDMREIVR